MSKKGVLWVVVVIVLLALAFIYWGGKEAVEPGAQDDTSALRVGDNAIVVGDQKPDNAATVSLVVLGAPGYVVVHEKKGEEAGDTIGSSMLLEKGEHKQVNVLLGTPLAEGKTYIAMLHLDDGDGVFEAASDAPAMLDGQPIMMEFEVSVDADVDVEVTI